MNRYGRSDNTLRETAELDWQKVCVAGLRRSLILGTSVAALSIGAVAINTVTPQPALALVCDSTNPVGGGTVTDGTGTDNTACGRNASATSQDQTTTNAYKATAYGWNAHAYDDSVAIGANAQANFDQTTAVGRNALTDSIGATAMGRNSSATNDYAISIGESSTASGSRSVAVGKMSNAQGDWSTATGYNSLAAGPYDTVGGANSQAMSDSGTIWGANTTIASASPNSSAYGSNVTIGTNSAYSLAVGHNTIVMPNAAGAVAMGTDSAGNGAVATLPNQYVMGTSNHTYTTPGITSALSKSRQSGPLQVVTSDAGGNLATDGGQIFSTLDNHEARITNNTRQINANTRQINANTLQIGRNSNRIADNQEGVAVAMSTNGPDLRANESFGMSLQWGGFEGSSAIGGGVTGVIYQGEKYRMALTGGVGVGLDEGTVGGRAGGQITW